MYLQYPQPHYHIQVPTSPRTPGYKHTHLSRYLQLHIHISKYPNITQVTQKCYQPVHCSLRSSIYKAPYRVEPMLGTEGHIVQLGETMLQQKVNTLSK